MAFCIHCGQKLPDHAKFCSSCGQPQPAKEVEKQEPQVISVPAAEEKAPEVIAVPVVEEKAPEVIAVPVVEEKQPEPVVQTVEEEEEDYDFDSFRRPPVITEEQEDNAFRRPVINTEPAEVEVISKHPLMVQEDPIPADKPKKEKKKKKGAAGILITLVCVLAAWGIGSLVGNLVGNASKEEKPANTFTSVQAPATEATVVPAAVEEQSQSPQGDVTFIDDWKEVSYKSFHAYVPEEATYEPMGETAVTLDWKENNAYVYKNTNNGMTLEENVLFTADSIYEGAIGDPVTVSGRYSYVEANGQIYYDTLYVVMFDYGSDRWTCIYELQDSRENQEQFQKFISTVFFDGTEKEPVSAPAVQSELVAWDTFEFDTFRAEMPYGYELAVIDEETFSVDWDEVNIFAYYNGEEWLPLEEYAMFLADEIYDGSVGEPVTVPGRYSYVESLGGIYYEKMYIVTFQDGGDQWAMTYELQESPENEADFQRFLESVHFGDSKPVANPKATATPPAGYKLYTCKEFNLHVPSNSEDLTGTDGLDHFTFVLTSNDMAIVGLEETFADVNNGQPMTELEYAQAFRDANGFLSTVEEGNGYHYFLFSNNGNEYMAAFFVTEDSVWSLQVGEKNLDEDRAHMIASSVFLSE